MTVVTVTTPHPTVPWSLDLLSDWQRAASAWHVPIRTAQARLQVMQRDWREEDIQALTSQQRTSLTFLYVKGVLACETSVTRKAQVMLAVGRAPQAPSPAGAIVLDARWLAVRRRLDSAFGPNRTGDTALSSVPSTWQTFDEVVRTPGLEAWGDPAASTVFFRDVAPGSLVLRVVEEESSKVEGVERGTGCARDSQQHSSCMQGPSVVAHYRACMLARAAGGAPASEDYYGTVDLTAFMQRSVGAEALWRYLYVDGGCSSILYLEVFASPWLGHSLRLEGSVLTLDTAFLKSRWASKEVLSLFDTHGPALIRCFVGGAYSLSLLEQCFTVSVTWLRHRVCYRQSRCSWSAKSPVLCQCFVRKAQSSQRALIWLAAHWRPMAGCSTPLCMSMWARTPKHPVAPTPWPWLGGERTPSVVTCVCWCRTGGGASSSSRLTCSTWCLARHSCLG
jgi:hypothetical protein